MASEAAPRRLQLTADDVTDFARGSRDGNPLHVDPEFAAQTAFGGCVTHGALVVLAMLGGLPEPVLRAVRSLRMLFPAAVRVGERLDVSARSGARGWEVRGEVRGKVAVRLLATDTPELFDAPTHEGPPRAVVPRDQPAAPDPARLRPGSAVAGDYELTPELPQLAQRLGAGALHPALLAGLAWCSYVVGMEIPGRHSLLAGLRLSTRAPVSSVAGFTLAVAEHDERTGQIRLAGTLQGAGEQACAAIIDCFALPGPRGPDLADLLPEEPPTAPRGPVAVIGASRGFGASLALALIARGFDVEGTYRGAAARAAELDGLADEVRRTGGPAPGRLSLTRANASDAGAMAQLAAARECAQPLAGLVLNAALPPLGMALSADSGPELAEYVAHSVSLAAVPLGALLHHLDERAFVVICSSAAVQAPPRDWPHYVAAKAALEGLGRWVCTTRPALRTVIVRLPKMDTAMTATPSGRLGASSADVIAARIADRLISRDLAGPLTILEPALDEVAA